jgi:predicted nucleic acid-binding Zn ribbon protein
MPQADPDDEDWTDDEDADAVACPECGAAIYADLDHCPQCGYWLTDADHRTRDPSLFQSRGVRIVALVMLVIFVLVLLAGSLGSF